MNEEALSAETLKRMIIKGSAENGTKDGFFGTDEDLDYVLNRIDSDTKFSSATNPDDDTTRVLFTPTRGMTSDLKSRLKLSEVQVDSSTAVLWGCLGIKTDRLNRNRTLKGIALMGEKDAQDFQEALQGDPRLLFQLSRAVNNGPITRSDGMPVDVQPGAAITICLNSPQAAPIRTVPFPTGYIANSIF